MESLDTNSTGLTKVEVRSDIEQEIKENAFARVGFELGHEDIATAIQRYLDFCALPESYTRSIAYPYFNEKEGSQVGHFVKGTGSNEDRKSFCHFRDGFPDQLKRDGVEITQQLDEFLQAAEAIHEAACRTLYGSMTELDDRYPGLVGMHFPEHGERDFYTRFLVYHPTGDGQLARAHYDKGSMTLAMAESHPGLRIGTQEDTLVPVEHREGEAKTFIGRSWPNLYPDSDLPFGWHDVIQHDAEQVSNDIVRWAVVTFANPEHDVQPSYKETHTPSA